MFIEVFTRVPYPYTFLLPSGICHFFSLLAYISSIPLDFRIMPANEVQCWCKTAKCNGQYTSYRTARTHADRDLRQAALLPDRIPPHEMLSVAPRINRPFELPAYIPGLRPLPQSLPSFPDLTAVPLPTSSNPIEQEMLDHGTMIPSDLYLDLPLSAPPFGIPSGDAFKVYVDHYTQHNITIAARALPLSASLALADPLHRQEEQQFLQQYEEQLTAAGQLPAIYSPAENSDLSSDNDIFLPSLANSAVEYQYIDEPEDDTGGNVDVNVNTDNDVDADVDSRAELSTLEVIPISMTATTSPDCDDPDPFEPLLMQDSQAPPLDDLAFHILCIYAVVTWLHFQFHLPHVACNALLATFLLVITILSPEAAVPFVTLKSANRMLGLDILPYQVMPVCPDCKEVYPASSETPEVCRHCQVALFEDSFHQQNCARLE